MADATDKTYLIGTQYKDAANLNARIQLHARFGTGKENWHRWLFDHYTIAQGSSILELGCGPGNLWQQNEDRIDDSWHITLSDFSAGMVQEAQHTLSQSKHHFTFKEFDAQAIPFDDASLDIVIANHMLYHVPDRAKALAEIRRVLKPTGRFYAATNGRAHLGKITEIIRRVDASYAFDAATRDAFSLESGRAQLEHYFSHVQLYQLDNILAVTEPEALIAYILSGAAQTKNTAEKEQKLRAIVREEFAADGVVRIQTVSGVFEAL